MNEKSLDINSIGKSEWIKRWAGSYTFISCAYWGSQYKYSLEKELGLGFNNVLFIHRQGTVSFFIKKNDFEKFGQYLANKAVRNSKQAIKLLDELKSNSDKILKIMKKLEGKVPTVKEYEIFLDIFDRHLAYHNFMKKTVDFLPPKTLNQLMKYFRDARIYSEPVYSETESFFRKLAREISKHEKYDANLLTCLLPQEITDYLNTGHLPPAAILKQRYSTSALYFKNGHLKLILGKKVDILEHQLSKNSKQIKGLVKGVVAYPGKVIGPARIVLNPHTVGKFEQGDILVTGMTRPEFLSIIKKAVAIVTDVGGVLCHAAIIARELKIPCIIGTGSATKKFKDGDSVEVDANNGIVKKILK